MIFFSAREEVTLFPQTTTRLSAGAKKPICVSFSFVFIHATLENEIKMLHN